MCFNIVPREECSSEDIFGVGIGEKFKRTDSVTAARRVIPGLVLHYLIILLINLYFVVSIISLDTNC